VTGADLARYRQAHRLTQRQAAERLGLAHKAELVPAHLLGGRLQEALKAALWQ
jgi:hypothetical protein